MGISVDPRCKKKPFQAYLFNQNLKKKVTLGMFATREEAQAALDVEAQRLGIIIKERIPEPDKKIKTSVKEKNGVLQFGVVP